MFDYYFIDIKIHQKKHTEQQIQEVIDIVKKLNMEDNVILSAGSVAKGRLENGWVYCGNPAVKVRKTEGVLR